MYKVSAETKDGSVGFNETFKTLSYTLRAVKSAVKKGFVVSVEEEE